MPVIELKNLTKDYGHNQGVFDLNLTIHQGEMVGFVGTNGSGKSTTMRCILGFIKPNSGEVKVNGLESWSHSSEICAQIGYVPGEIAFPDLKTGTDFLESQMEFLQIKDKERGRELITRLQLDPSAYLKKMSKGMKQKTALVAALMNDAPILLLDEPTTGLDPLMRDIFIDIIKKEHARGKTIFMSSHMLNEVEDTCDRVVLLANGKIVAIADMNELRNRPVRDFKIEFHQKDDYLAFKKEKFAIIRDQKQYSQVTIRLPKTEINAFFSSLKKYDVKFISEVKYTLERHFQEMLNLKGGDVHV